MSELAKLSDFREYPHGIIPVILWEVDNPSNPCISPRTKVTVYADMEAEIFYSDANKGQRVNGRFFPQDNNYEMYFDITNGVKGYDETFTCDITQVRYEDMPHPESIDIYNQYLLAVYPSYQVVVKYDLREGTNPLGQVVAGQWGRMKNAKNQSNLYLNMPQMVAWRDDGERFAVYSGGILKSISFYDKNGNLLRNLQSVGSWVGTDYGIIPTPMRYNYDSTTQQPTSINPPEDGKPSFVGDLTPMTMEDVPNTHIVTKLEYVTNGSYPHFYDVEYETLYVGMYYRGDDRSSSYKIWAFTPFQANDLQDVPYHIHNFAKLTHNPGDAPERDMIPDFAVSKKSGTETSYTNKLYMAYPYGWGYSTPYPPMQNYTAREYTYNYNYTGGYGTASVRVLGERTMAHGASKNNLYFGKHVKAEVQIKGNKIFVVTTSSSTSQTRFLMENVLLGLGTFTAAVWLSYWASTGFASLAKIVEVPAWFLFKFGTTGTLKVSGAKAVLHAVPWALAVLAVLYLGYRLWSMFSKRNWVSTDVGVSMSTISGSASNPTYSESSTWGVYGRNVNWLPNDGIKMNNVVIDRAESADNLYAIQLDGSIKKGLWTAYSGTEVLKEVKDRIEE